MEQAQPRRSDRHTDPDGRPRRGALLALLVAFLVLVGGAVAAGAYYGHCKGASGPKRDVAFTVEPGTSGEQIVSALHALGVVRCGGIVGRILLRGTGKADAIRAGSYTLTTNMTLNEAVGVLSTPPPAVPTVRLTIPEGYRLTQIAERVHDELGIGVDGFLSLAQARDWSLEPYLPAGKGTEGFLFPETYRFSKGVTTAKDVIQRLLDQFATEAEGLDWGKAQALGVSEYEVVVIASMIEREAAVASDRAKIAAVIYNRLAEGMPLGIDATIGYIDPNPSNGLTVSDLEIDSPYNTRLHAGLPPTPIASPGIASLRAALAPADVPYLYYVLCGDNGAHRFSVGYHRFLSDKAECLG
ncbi:MAG: endolytic transglycosylase MltG [Actinomycetota bacterium]